MTGLARWLLTFVILCGCLVACSDTTDHAVNLPDAFRVFDRDPFGDLSFAAIKRARDPLWDWLHPEHPDLKLYEFGISEKSNPDSVDKELLPALGPGWVADPVLSTDSHWGWSIGYRLSNHVCVLVVAHPQLIKSSAVFGYVPASILTDIPVNHPGERLLRR